jgi:hypothetical protein
VLGVLGCPNLPLASIQNATQNVEQIGCLFSAIVGKGAWVQSLEEDSSPTKVNTYFSFLLLLLHTYSVC